METRLLYAGEAWCRWHGIRGAGGRFVAREHKQTNKQTRPSTPLSQSSESSESQAREMTASSTATPQGIGERLVI